MIAAGGAVAEADGAAPGRRWAPKLGGRRWRDADFLKLWAGQSICRLGTFVTGLALPTAVIELLGAGPVEVGALAALQSLPFAVPGIPSGVLVDRLPRRPIMNACDLGRLAALASIPLVYLWYGLSTYHLYAVALPVGT
jgi:MFS family permease